LRARSGRNPLSSAGIADSQSAKTTDVGGGEQRGYDGGKKVRGRKRPCWWTPRVWSSKPGYTAPRCPSKTDRGFVSALCVFLATEAFRKDIAKMVPVVRQVIAESRVQ
jgi:hypothetical protein